ncbi:MAG: efflux RND transporter periplasmic adaptor subunit [candidate division Zixibacteria bacterium]|nr:efflux RND transporter periplasmic adaptor subunit [candidate division Zixibacteria bacterium]
MRFIIYVYLLIVVLVITSCGKGNLPPGGSGLIEATEIVVSSEVAGQLKSLRFDEGDSIKMGDTIAGIDTITTMLRLQQAEASKQMTETKVKISSINIEQASYNLDLAQKEYERVSALIKSGSINQQEYDRTETAYNQAVLSKKQADAAYDAAVAELAKSESEIALLKKQLNDCFPKSPESGVVINKFVEVGELIGVGKPLVKIAKLDTVWVKVYLPPSDLTRISLGGHAKVDPEDGRNQPLDGKVSWISDQAEFTPKNVQTKEARADLVYAVKITIPNPGKILKIGMPVSVKIQ